MPLVRKTGEVKFQITGPLVYPAGEYDDNVTYTRTTLAAPVVLYDTQYYILNKKGSFKGINPKTDYAANGAKATWIRMDQMKYAFIEILMANYAKLASAVFYGDYMFSQHGKDASGNDTADFWTFDPSKLGDNDCPFTPNLMLDFLLGKFVGLDAFIKGRVEADEGVFKGVSITDATITKCKIENVLMQGAARITTGGPGALYLTNTYTVFDSSDFYYPSLRVRTAKYGGLELTLDAPVVFELMNLNAAVVSVSFFDASKNVDGKCNANNGYNWTGPWVTTGNLMKFDILTMPTGCCCTVMFIPKKEVLTLYAGDWYLLDSNKYQLYYHPRADDRFKYEMIPLAPSAMITV